MSVLGFPRICFNGAFRTNPCTANNDYESLAVDTELIRLKPPLDGLPDDEAREWLMETFQDENGQTWMRAGWNFYADYSTNIDGAKVVSAVGEDGSAAPGDPALGASIAFAGAEGTYPVIVDVDPRGIITTQFFVGGFNLQGAQSSLQAVHDTRAYTRWRNNTRILGSLTPLDWSAGAIMQFGFPHDSLTFSGAESGVLGELRGAALKGLGVMLQFCIYRIERRMSEAELVAKFQAGQFVRNPAYAVIAGSLGVWEEGDFATDVNGRHLLPGRRPDLEHGGSNYTLGPLAARFHPGKKIVSVSLLNTVPEVETGDVQNPLEKVDIGDLTLEAAGKDGKFQPIAVIAPQQYGYRSYTGNGGIVDLPYDPAAVPEDGLLRLAAADGRALLNEPAFTIQSDDRAIYLDEGGKATVQLTVKQRGEPSNGGYTLRVWEYQYQDQNAGTGKALTDFELVQASGGQQRLSFPALIDVTPGHGPEVRVEVEALSPGPCLLAFTIGSEPPPGGPKSPVFPWMTANYILFRVLPLDDYGPVPDDKLSWEFVYEEVLKYYYVLFPAMSQIIPLNSQEAIRNSAKAILDRMDPKRWGTTLYMPVTRVMSSGKRKLFERWARQVAQGGDGR